MTYGLAPNTNAKNISLKHSYDVLESAYKHKIPLNKRALLQKTADKWEKSTPFKGKEIAFNNHLTLFTLVTLATLIKAQAKITFIATRDMALDGNLLSVLKEANIPFYVALNIFKNLPNHLLANYLPANNSAKDLLPAEKEKALENYLNDLSKNIPENKLFKDLEDDVRKQIPQELLNSIPTHLLDKIPLKDFIRIIPEEQRINHFDVVFDTAAGTLNKIKSRKGASELTHVNNEEYANTNNGNGLSYPVFSADQARTKLLEKRLGTGDGCIRALIRRQRKIWKLIPDMPVETIKAHLFQNKNYVIMGAGEVGLGVAYSLHREGVPYDRITLIDISKNACARAGVEGYKKVYRLRVTLDVNTNVYQLREPTNTNESAEQNNIRTALKNAFCIITATGQENCMSIFNPEDISKDTLKINMSTTRDWGLNHKEVLNNGELFNFSLLDDEELPTNSEHSDDKFPTDPRYLDLSFTPWLLLGELLLAPPVRLKHKVYPLYSETGCFSSPELKLVEKLSEIERECLLEWSELYPEVAKRHDLPGVIRTLFTKINDNKLGDNASVDAEDKRLLDDQSQLTLHAGFFRARRRSHTTDEVDDARRHRLRTSSASPPKKPTSGSTSPAHRNSISLSPPMSPIQPRLSRQSSSEKSTLSSICGDPTSMSISPANSPLSSSPAEGSPMEGSYIRRSSSP